MACVYGPTDKSSDDDDDDADSSDGDSDRKRKKQLKKAKKAAKKAKKAKKAEKKASAAAAPKVSRRIVYHKRLRNKNAKGYAAEDMAGILGQAAATAQQQ